MFLKRNSFHFMFPIVLVLLSANYGFAQNGKLQLHVTPRRAYVFVDDHAISEASKHPTLTLAAGDHKVELVNYGYAPVTRTVTIVAGQTTPLEVNLQPVGAKVSGPFGAISVKGADRDAVLLNGKTPDFFVGHGDEFNTDFLWWKQELVVPPGTYDMTVQSGDKDVWSGQVTVAADQRVVVAVPKGVKKTVSWHRGDKLGTVPRFTVGVASATVAVAKPTAEVSASASQLNCGDSSQLKWTSTDAPKIEISPLGPVAISGEQAVQPTQTTTYTLTGVGPGGTTTSNVTVNVNSAVQADLTLSPAEVQYKRVGDQVIQQGSSALNWNSSNASSVSINSLGTVDASGTQNLSVVPKRNDPGPVDETVTYTLNATNVCGGSETKTVALHIVGEIVPGALLMRSVYFPTDMPKSVKSETALLASEKETLRSIAEEFKKYLAYKPDAHLLLAGHADRRGPQAYNKPLSERRAELAKRFLVEQGVPEANIEVQAFGKESNLTTEQVRQLLDQDIQLSEEKRQMVTKKLDNIVLAYNRRVDLTLSSTGQESARTYPFDTEDFARLVDRNGPKKPNGVELAAQREREGN
ncbi:MAG: OmpA family protein [Acidobacteriaceae bacterium]|nr:OmpA family protein [Acidobacteriaceae bacterium]